MYRFRYDDGTYKARSELEDIMSKVGRLLAACGAHPAGGPCSLPRPEGMADSDPALACRA